MMTSPVKSPGKTFALGGKIPRQEATRPKPESSKHGTASRTSSPASRTERCCTAGQSEDEIPPDSPASRTVKPNLPPLSVPPAGHIYSTSGEQPQQATEQRGRRAPAKSAAAAPAVCSTALTRTSSPNSSPNLTFSYQFTSSQKGSKNRRPKFSPTRQGHGPRLHPQKAEQEQQHDLQQTHDLQRHRRRGD